jgi:DNA-binding PadR family transcriptional regulator
MMGWPMRRDMELVRSLLLRIEEMAEAAEKADDRAGLIFNTEDNREGLEAYTPSRVLYHLHLLQKAGFVEGQELLSSGREVSQFAIDGITWEGHEFLDDVRDPELWRKTKEGAKQAGVASIGLLWEFAKGFAKQEAKRRGLDLG